MFLFVADEKSFVMEQLNYISSRESIKSWEHKIMVSSLVFKDQMMTSADETNTRACDVGVKEMLPLSPAPPTQVYFIWLSFSPQKYRDRGKALQKIFLRTITNHLKRIKIS